MPVWLIMALILRLVKNPNRPDEAAAVAYDELLTALILQFSECFYDNQEASIRKWRLIDVKGRREPVAGSQPDHVLGYLDICSERR
jgi:hypothetical protein